jgi:hypothetical protein
MGQVDIDLSVVRGVGRIGLDAFACGGRASSRPLSEGAFLRRPVRMPTFPRSLLGRAPSGLSTVSRLAALLLASDVVVIILSGNQGPIQPFLMHVGSVVRSISMFRWSDTTIARSLEPQEWN